MLCTLHTGYCQLIQWDIAVEKDDITENEEVPPQLLFIHQVIEKVDVLPIQKLNACCKLPVL